MVKFEVTSAKECTIDGLGYFAAGEKKQLTEREVKRFQAMHGYPIAEANFPAWVELAAVTDGEGGK